MVSTFTFSGVHAATTMLPVTTSGNQILDSNGNVVYLRGVGMAGMAPDIIFWGSRRRRQLGRPVDGSLISVCDTDVCRDATVWHVNMIRIFIYPEWWMTNNVVPSTASGQGYSSTAVSTQTYLQTLASVAEQYGIYIDIVPYQLTCYKGSFSSDPYITSNMAGSQGLPMSGNWDIGSNQLPRKHRLNGTSILDNLLDINGKRTQSIPKRHLRSMERTSRRLSQHHTIRLPKLFDDDVQRSQSNRSNKPNHDAVATRMGTQRRTKPKLGITNQHSPRRKPNQHRLHHTPLLLLTIQRFALLEQRIITYDGLTT